MANQAASFRRVVSVLVSVLLLAVSCLTAMPSRAGESLVLGKSEASLSSSISAAVLREAYQRLGIDLVVKELPARQSVMRANSGGLDGDVQRKEGISREYPNLLMVPVAINRIDFVAMTKKVDFPVNGWSSLKPYALLIQRGALAVEEGTAGMNVFPSDNPEAIISLLLKGRGEVGIDERLDALSAMNKFNVTDIRILEPPVASIILYHYLHQRHVALVPKITAVLKKMESEGRIKAIREQMIREVLYDKLKGPNT